MHPVYAKINFGVHGVLARYYNGSAVTNGYITKQTGVNKFVVTDGTHPVTCTLAQTSTQVAAIGSGSPTLCTIPISPALSTASGAAFVINYAIDTTSTVAAGGAGYASNDSVTVDGGVRPTGTITIATNPAALDTITVGGTAITFETSGATGNQVNLGGTAALTTAALYTFLSGSADANIAKCWYYNAAGSNVITVISKTSGTTNNAFTLATSVPGKITVPATLAGGTAATASTPSVVTLSQTGGVASSIATITTAGSWQSLPSGSVYGYYTGSGRLPVQLTLGFVLPVGTTAITVSGGTGYAVGDALVFNGLTDVTTPSAHISAVSAGAATQVTVDTTGAGITALSSISVAGPVEHVKTLFDSVCQTVEGNRYSWTLGSSQHGTAVIAKYS